MRMQAPDGMIQLSEPEIRGNEWKYVQECLETGWVSSAGTFVDRFEREMAACIGARYAVATSSGTAALHVALLAAGVQPDDEILVSTLTFIAPVNAVRYVGAWPVFMDADPRFWQMDAQKVVDFLERECRWTDGALRNKTTGRRVSGILPVHILGHPVDMDPIVEVTRKYRLVVVEDATESLGAKYKGSAVGHLGDIACFSFNGNKIITTGGGGMLVTDREDWARKAKYLTTQAKDDPVEFVHKEIGFNYRLTNVQAALGCAQLEQLSQYVAAKRRIADAYEKGLEGLDGVTCMQEAPWAFSTFWLYTVLVNPERYKEDRRTLLKELAQAKVETRPLWQPIHRSPAHAGCQAYRCDHAERVQERALCLPSSVGLTDSQQRWVIEQVRMAGYPSAAGMSSSDLAWNPAP